MEILEIGVENSFFLEKFISKLGNSINTFRYFINRDISVIKNHLITLLLINEKGMPVCYGHLDLENSKVWLGIAVIEDEIGKGYSKIMMNNLLEKSKHFGLKVIYLTVDIDNSKAISLYEKYDFVEIRKDRNICLMERFIA